MAYRKRFKKSNHWAGQLKHHIGDPLKNPKSPWGASTNHNKSLFHNWYPCNKNSHRYPPLFPYPLLPFFSPVWVSQTQSPGPRVGCDVTSTWLASQHLTTRGKGWGALAFWGMGPWSMECCLIQFVHIATLCCSASRYIKWIQMIHMLFYVYNISGWIGMFPWPWEPWKYAILHLDLVTIVPKSRM